MGNLNPKYISWIKTLLKNFQSSIMINGFPTPRISVGRGCRQGDPIAGYLFIICVELLLLKLQSCKQIQPWQTITNQLKLLDAYADDINLFLAYNHPTQQLNHILRVLEDFKKLSGLATNVSKTKYAKKTPEKPKKHQICQKKTPNTPIFIYAVLSRTNFC